MQQEIPREDAQMESGNRLNDSPRSAGARIDLAALQRCLLRSMSLRGRADRRRGNQEALRRQEIRRRQDQARRARDRRKRPGGADQHRGRKPDDRRGLRQGRACLCRWQSAARASSATGSRRLAARRPASTRMRLAQTQNIVCVAEMSNGSSAHGQGQCEGDHRRLRRLIGSALLPGQRRSGEEI